MGILFNEKRSVFRKDDFILIFIIVGNAPHILLRLSELFELEKKRKQSKTMKACSEHRVANFALVTLNHIRTCCFQPGVQPGEKF